MEHHVGTSNVRGRSLDVKPVMDIDAVSRFLDTEFPQIHAGGRVYTVARIENGAAEMRFEPGDAHLRPGGTVSGPSLFALADVAAYVVVLAHIGPVGLAVTTNLSMDFLRKPPPSPLLGRAVLLKLGRRLAVTRVEIVPEGTASCVAHAVVTYSIPPDR